MKPSFFGQSPNLLLGFRPLQLGSNGLRSDRKALALKWTFCCSQAWWLLLQLHVHFLPFSRSKVLLYQPCPSRASKVTLAWFRFSSSISELEEVVWGVLPFEKGRRSLLWSFLLKSDPVNLIGDPHLQPAAAFADQAIVIGTLSFCVT